MTKYDIKTDTFEFRFRRGLPIPAMSGSEILETYLSCDDRITSNSIAPALEASFDSEEEAREAFRAGFAGYGATRRERSFAGLPLLTGTIAFIERNEYDEDGEFDQGGEILDYSAEAFSLDEDDE